VVSEGPQADLGHLHESVRRVALLPAAERLRYVRADRWIGYTRAAKALAQLEDLLVWPEKQRMPNLLLIGPTNNGKSMIIEKFRRSHPVVSHADREEIPVLAVQMPSDPKVTRFYNALMAAMGAPMRPGRATLTLLEQLTLRLLRETGVQMLVIDELHNVLAGTVPPTAGVFEPAAVPGQRAEDPAGGSRHPGRLPGDPVGRSAGEPVRAVRPAALAGR
jgi:hypothetical protein